MRIVFATGADAVYGDFALNLVGSLHTNSPGVFDEVVVFDLGLTATQRRRLATVAGIELREVPRFSPHWSQGFTWKPWVWTHLETEALFWLDAGATLLRSLAPAVAQIRERGYFLVSQGNELCDIVPPDYVERYGVPADALDQPYVAAGIIGFRRDGAFYDRIVVPTYEDCLAGRNLGFSAAEAAGRNRGLSRETDPPIRDCAHFRWDQTILNARLAADLPTAVVNDMDEYAGWRSARDHPRQVIWSHRRHGNLAYLKHVPYTERQALQRLWGTLAQLGWWLHLRQPLSPAIWLLKARKERARLRALLAARARGPRPSRPR